MPKYVVQLIIDTEASEISNSLRSVNEFVKFIIREASCIDSDQIEIGKAAPLTTTNRAKTNLAKTLNTVQTDPNAVNPFVPTNSQKERK